jgi:hypothetical protein
MVVIHTAQGPKFVRRKKRCQCTTLCTAAVTNARFFAAVWEGSLETRGKEWLERHKVARIRSSIFSLFPIRSARKAHGRFDLGAFLVPLFSPF